jgi:hypothetical protein
MVLASKIFIENTTEKGIIIQTSSDVVKKTDRGYFCYSEICRLVWETQEFFTLSKNFILYSKNSYKPLNFSEL